MDLKGSDVVNKKLYVGNLNYNTTEERLRELFEQYGKVMSAKVVTDFNTGMSRGFGFIEMSTEEEAQAAMTSLNGYVEDDRELKVNEARERGQDRGRRRDY